MLWFTETYGLTVKKIQLESASGEEVNLDLARSHSASECILMLEQNI